MGQDTRQNPRAAAIGLGQKPDERFFGPGTWLFDRGRLRCLDSRLVRLIGLRLALEIIASAMQLAIELFASFAKFVQERAEELHLRA
jgi:hypothetical protein